MFSLGMPQAMATASLFSDRFWHLHWMVIMPSVPQ